MDNLEELAKGTPFDGLFEGDKIKPAPVKPTQTMTIRVSWRRSIRVELWIDWKAQSYELKWRWL